MISYEPFYKTIKEKNISTYKLINSYGISRSLIDRLKHNKPISTVTLNDLCAILDCRVEDILLLRMKKHKGLSEMQTESPFNII
jgi:DNA-binding Xre family transcriptional regulator